MRLVKSRFLIALVVSALLTGSAHAVTPILKEIEDAFIRIGQDVRPSVVNIEVKGALPEEMEGQVPPGFEDFFKFFGVPGPQQGPHMKFRPPVGLGSGFIYDKEGHIITNNHVVANAEKIKVRLSNEKVYDAEVVGADEQTDVAVIKIKPDTELSPVKLGDSDALKVGQFAIALGSPRGLEGSLSFGHVSALGREELKLPNLRFQHLIQTDAAINLGNSGGPLCNIDGEVIGMNVAIVYGAQSLGFAIPVNTIKKVVPTLIAQGKMTRGYLGVRIAAAEEFAEAVGLPDKSGAFVVDVSPGTPAEKAGLQTYDVLRTVNGAAVTDDRDLVNKISDLAPGAKVALEVWRTGKLVNVEVQLGEFPATTAKTGPGGKKITVLGLEVQPVTPQVIQDMGLDPGTKGVLVADVEAGSPAEEAGIEPGDIILDVAKQPVASVEQFRTVMKENAVPGKHVLVRVAQGRGTPVVVVLKVPAEEQPR